MVTVLAPGGVTGFGLMPVLVPAGLPVADNVTSLVKPLTWPTVMLYTASVPTQMSIGFGLPPR